MIRLAAALALAALPALAQEDGEPGAGTDRDAGTPAAAMLDAVDAMEKGMAGMELTGQPDTDFLLLLTAQHEAAVAMARVALERGEVPIVREFAQRVIDQQTAEIEEMRQMLVELNHAIPQE